MWRSHHVSAKGRHLYWEGGQCASGSILVQMTHRIWPAVSVSNFCDVDIPLLSTFVNLTGRSVWRGWQQEVRYSTRKQLIIPVSQTAGIITSHIGRDMAITCRWIFLSHTDRHVTLTLGPPGCTVYIDIAIAALVVIVICTRKTSLSNVQLMKAKFISFKAFGN